MPGSPHIMSDVTCSLVTQLITRDEKGQAKYGTSLDRKDLALEDWLQHQIEELLDGAGYAAAALREISKLRVELQQARRQAQEYALLRHDIDQAIRVAEHMNMGDGGHATRAGSASYGRDKATEVFKLALHRFDTAQTLRQLSQP